MTTGQDTELTRPWRTPSRSTGSQECVEVAQAQAHCLVRDSKNPNGTRLAVNRQAWTAFTGAIKDGTFGA
jgi:hypothetical protein